MITFRTLTKQKVREPVATGRKTTLEELSDMVSAVTPDTYIPTKIKLGKGDVVVGTCTPHIMVLQSVYTQLERRLLAIVNSKEQEIEALEEVLKKHTPSMPPHFEEQDINIFLNLYPALKTKNERIQALVSEQLEIMVLTQIAEDLLNFEIFKTFPALRTKEGEAGISSAWEVFYHDQDLEQEFILEIEIPKPKKIF